jgi:hypothetical protein
MNIRIMDVGQGILRELTVVMNLSHVVHEFSFGPFFPAISQPLDMSVETTTKRKPLT